MADPPPPARRYKTTLSCAECRRLKLRCDRVFPCRSCQRRGCASICPDGQMPPSKSSRKDTPSQLEILRTRVQDLEQELAALQKKASHSSQPLHDRDNVVKLPSHDDLLQSHSEDTQNLTESLGTLSITGYGKSRFFGITGGTAQLLWNIEDDDSKNGPHPRSLELDACDFPPEILFLISAFPSPIPSRASPEIWNWIIESLPSQMEAWSLVETFYENGAYIFMPLPRTMFLEHTFSFFYGSNHGPTVDIPRGHRLALLLMVFAIAELLDLTKPAMPTGGKRFYYLARAALTLDRLYEHPTTTAVQVIILIMMYLNMSDHQDSAELVFVLSGINLKLSMMLGLHRDSAKFTIDGPGSPVNQRSTHVPNPAETELRRTIFHEVVHFELWQALALGRPSLLRFEQYDCLSPGEGPERDNVHERNHVKGQAWSYGFIRECLINVLDFTVGIKPPKYADVIELDAKIRTYEISDNVHVDTYENEGVDPSKPASRAVTMLRYSAHSMKEVTLLYLHRSCFASAMSDFPDPFSSPFKHSVFASFQSASNIVSKVVTLYKKEPRLTARIHLFWGQLFVSCVLGAFVVRCPSCSLAPIALADLDAASDLCQKAQEGARPAAILPRILDLRRKAHTAFQLYDSAGQPGLSAKPEAVDVSAELSALAGSSRSRPMTSQTSSASPPEITATRQSSTSPPAAPNPPPPLGESAVYMPNSTTLGGVPVYSNYHWNPSVESAPSIPPKLGSQEVFDFPDFIGGDTDVTPFIGGVLQGDTLLQSGISTPEVHLDGYSPEMEPTWQSFMQQLEIGFN